MYVYLIREGDFTHNYKIGVSKNVNKRLNELQTGNSKKLSIIEKYFSENNARNIEKAFHNYNKLYHIRGELFDFSEDITVVENFMKLCEQYENNFITLKKLGNKFIR